MQRPLLTIVQALAARVVQQRPTIRVGHSPDMHGGSIIRRNNGHIGRRAGDIIHGDRRDVIADHFCIHRADAVELPAIGNRNCTRPGIVRQGGKIALFPIIGTQNPPGARPEPFLRRIPDVEIVRDIPRLVDITEDRRRKGGFLRQGNLHAGFPTTVWCGPKGSTAFKPFHTTQRRTVLVFMRATLHANLDEVACVGPHDGREWVTVADIAGQFRIGSRPNPGVELPHHPVGPGLQSKGQITGRPVGLGTPLIVGPDLVRIVDTVAHGLVTIVDQEGPDIRRRDGFRTRTRHASRADRGEAGRIREGMRLPVRRVQGVTEGFIRDRDRHAILIDAGIDAPIISVGKILRFEIELAIAVIRSIIVDVAGQNDGLPGGRPAIVPGVHLLTSFIVQPLGARWIDQQGCIEPDLLVRTRSKVVVGKGNPQTPVDALHIVQRVNEPALNIGSGTEILSVGPRPEVRVRLSLELFIAKIILDHISVNRLDPDPNGFGTENTILIVPAIAGTIRGHEVPFGQVNVLANHVGRRGDLIVVHIVEFRHEIGLIVICAFEGIQTEHEGLRRTRLVKRRRHIIPQGQDTLLRIVIAGLIEDDVHLNIRRLINAWIVRAILGDRGIIHPAILAGEEITRASGIKDLAPVIHTGLKEWGPGRR